MCIVALFVGLSRKVIGLGQSNEATMYIVALFVDLSRNQTLLSQPAYLALRPLTMSKNAD